jgi:hypothetical protein
MPDFLSGARPVDTLEMRVTGGNGMQLHEGQRLNPGFFGPLDDEFAPVTGAVRLFAGEDRFLSNRKLDAREKLLNAIDPILGRVLDDDETVLYVAPAIHNPRFLEVFGFGVWYVLFFRAALVLTDRRVVEVMLKKPDRADTCIRSYSWGQVEKLKLSMGTLTLKPAEGRTQKWKIQERGDRKLFKLLLPKIEEQLVPGDIHAPRPVPLWHCPECGAASPKYPKVCGQCGTRFKSQGLAASLALAFPGAGLLYAGHPVLAIFDLFGEVMLYVIVAVSFLLATGSEAVASAVILGAILLFMTKLESAHVASVLVHRTRPDPTPSKWKRGAVVGAVLSVALMAVPPVFTGVLGGVVNVVDRDLDFANNDLGWVGGHDPDGWVFGSEPNQRSEWIRDDGQGLFVWSLPMGLDETEEVFIATVAEGLGADKVQPTAVGGFDGIRVVEENVDEDGEQFLWVRWMLFDREYNDVHILATSTLPGQVEVMESEVDRLVSNASWIAATY